MLKRSKAFEGLVKLSQHVIAPFGYHRLKSATKAGLPRWCYGPLEFLISTNIGREDRPGLVKLDAIWKHLSNLNGDCSVLLGAQSDSQITRSIRFLTDVSSIPRYWGTFLHLWANAIPAKSILEMGACLGVSSCYLATSQFCERFVTIEGSPQLAAITQKHLAMSVSNFQVINSLFDEALDQVLGDQFDLIYIDGDHTEEATLRYFSRVTRSLKPGASVILDDINWSPGMWKAWQTISRQPGSSHAINLGRIGVVLWDGETMHPQSFDLSPFIVHWARGYRS